MLKQISRLLKRAKKKKVDNFYTIKDYPSLVKAAIQKDFLTEITRLSEAIALKDIEAIKEQFALLCHDRAQRNQGTALSFTINPTLPCNNLYFEIANILYPEASFLDIFKLLLPEITHQWVIEHAVNKMMKNSKRKPVETLAFAQKPIDENYENPLNDISKRIDSFTQMICIQNSVFVISQFESFDFNLHYDFYQLLDSVPQLREALREYNEDINQLYNTIAQIGDEVKTIGEFLQPLVLKMTLSGESVHNNEWATAVGNQAAQRIVQYHAQLNPNIRERLDKLGSLSYNDNFATMIGEIKSEACIEWISTELQEVLNNPQNQEVLEITPYSTSEEKKATLAHYEKLPGKSIISLDNTRECNVLPTELLKQFYRNIEIQSSDSLLYYLLHLPTTEYQAFLSIVGIDDYIINVNSLKFISTHLNFEQHLAFFEAVISIYPPTNFLCFNLQALGETESLKKLLNSVPEEECIIALEEADSLNNTLFHLALTSYPDSLKALMDSLPKNKKGLEILISKNTVGDSPIYLAARRNIPFFISILRAFTEEQHIKTIIKALNHLLPFECRLLCKHPEINGSFPVPLLDFIQKKAQFSQQDFFDLPTKKLGDSININSNTLLP